MSSRLSLLQGLNSQPDRVLPIQRTATPSTSAAAAAFFAAQNTSALDNAEAEVDAVVNPSLTLVRRPKMIHVPQRKLGKSYEEVIHKHLTNPKFGTCYSRSQAFLLGLEMGQDRLAKQKQEMHQMKTGLRELIKIREILLGAVQQQLDATGDKTELYIAGEGASTVCSQHLLEKNMLEDWKHENAIEASRANLKRRAAEMEQANEDTVRESKKFRAWVDKGEVLMSDEPIDLNKNEGILSANIRQAIERKRVAEAALIEHELRDIANYKYKLREAEARYKDLCRAHMLIYLELKREGWENIPVHYRRPGYWFGY